ncbi:hypothetical protein Tco_0849821 [Tanacetum coccineum]
MSSICNKSSGLNGHSVLAAKKMVVLGVSGLFALNRAFLYEMVLEIDFSSPRMILFGSSGQWRNYEILAIFGLAASSLEALISPYYALDIFKDASIGMLINVAQLDNNFRRQFEGGIEQSSSSSLRTCSLRSLLNPCLIDGSGYLGGSGEFSVALCIRDFIDDQRLLTVDSIYSLVFKCTD